MKACDFIAEYDRAVSCTDVLPHDEVAPVLHGLFGEVGGIMATAKKHVRERAAYPGFRQSAEEEFGDTLWYLAALCRRLGVSLPEVFTEASKQVDYGDGEPSGVEVAVESLDETLFRLGRSAADLMTARPGVGEILGFAINYLNALRASRLSLPVILGGNVRKVRGAFVAPDHVELPDFDTDYEEEEQLPRKFTIRVSQRKSGRSYLQWNGVFIGDPLTDNIADRDGYRFHDAFHFAYAAILHWSPVVRALIKQKRKSCREIDEEQDGGRAIVVEEGLTAWLFAKAKELNFFEGQDRVSLGTLKTVEEFVAGFEVSRCPLKLWERAILDGYSVFRKLKANNGGWIIGDRAARSIQFAPLAQSK